MKDEALKLALEALQFNGNIWHMDCKKDEAIAAAKAALAQPEQEPTEAWPCVIETADFEEDTVTLAMQCTDYKVSAGKHWLSTTPPQRTEERNFCPRCGKRTPDLETIHTCTPPQEKNT